MVFALVHGFASITQRGNQIVSGVAINFLASGLTAFLGQAWFGEGGRTPQLRQRRALPADHAAGRRRDARRPGHRAASTPTSFPATTSSSISPSSRCRFTAWVVYRTRFGLRLRAVGENPAAVDTAGISVTCAPLPRRDHRRHPLRLRRRLSLARAIGRLRPRHDGGAGLHRARRADLRQLAAVARCSAPASCSVSSSAIAIRLQGVVLPGIGQVPVQFIQALPYILTVILLAGFIGKSIAAERRRRALREGAVMADSAELFEAARAAMRRRTRPIRSSRSARRSAPRAATSLRRLQHGERQLSGRLVRRDLGDRPHGDGRRAADRARSRSWPRRCRGSRPAAAAVSGCKEFGTAATRSCISATRRAWSKPLRSASCCRRPSSST